MSAFLVDDYHINALVSWAYARNGHKAVTYYWSGSRRDIRHDPRRVASVMFAENVRSVNARYQESDPAHGFTYRHVMTGRFSAADIVNACRCLSYQSCEADGWQDSEAYAVIEAIKDAAVRDLCEGSDVCALRAPTTTRSST